MKRFFALQELMQLSEAYDPNYFVAKYLSDRYVFMNQVDDYYDTFLLKKTTKKAIEEYILPYNVYKEKINNN